MIRKSKTQKLLEDAAPSAVSVLVDVLADDALPRALRVDVAKDVLNRAYGKAAPVEKEEVNLPTIALSENTKELSK
ncbi:MAG: hypothetical protein RR573_02915 [Oscillospiraceae bacterium]